MPLNNETEEDLPISQELKAFFFDSDENVDDALIHFIKQQGSKHKNLGCSLMSIENYFVHKAMIVERRRLYKHISKLLKYNLIEKSDRDGYSFYKIKK